MQNKKTLQCRSGWTKDLDCSHFLATTSPFLLSLGEMHTEEKWFIQNLTVALGNRFYNSSQLILSTFQHFSEKMILLHKILAIKGFYYLFLFAIHRIGKTALIGNRLWTSLEAKILRPFRDWVGLARRLQGDQVPKCNDQHCQWLHPPFLYCFSCYWGSIQEDTSGKVWSGWKQKLERDGSWNWSQQCKGS